MELRIRNLLNQGCLKNSKIISGMGGIDNEVKGVTVQEITIMDDKGIKLISKSIKAGDIILTSFYDIKDDIDKQKDLIQRIHACKAAAIILFYVGDVVKNVDPSIIALCDELNLPIICPSQNSGISYQDVILTVMSILNTGGNEEEKSRTELVNKMISFSKHERPVQQALELIWERLGCSVAIFDGRRKTLLKHGLDLEKLIGYFESHSYRTDQNNEIKDPVDSRWLIRSINKHQGVFWLGAYESHGDHAKIRMALYLLGMILELWAEDFEKESEAELIRSIIREDKEAARKFAGYQKHDLNHTVGMIMISMKENMDNIVTFRERIESLKM